MTVDSLFQLIDRQAIALLKVFHYTQAGNHEAAALAQEQADDLRIAGDLYIYECVTGKRRPHCNPHLRFHDHRVTDGKWAGKKVEMEMPTSIMDCAGKLALVHARYWANQTRLQTLKGMIDRNKDMPDLAHFQGEFVAAQRLTDILNQTRNDLINLGDEMVVKAFGGRQ